MKRTIAQIRCPSPLCSAVFDIPAERLGRNVYCLSCGKRMTAKPIDAGPELRAREQRIRGGSGTGAPRLPFVVLVDDVRSLWNVGSIFRTADACGVERVLLTGITGSPPRREISKTALGAEEAVAWSYHAGAREALEEARALGYTPVALERAESSVPIESLAWPKRPCLLIGNEVVGLSEALLKECVHFVHIPMGGIKQSFNVAVAFGIAARCAAMALSAAHPEVRFS